MAPAIEKILTLAKTYLVDNLTVNPLTDALSEAELIRPEEKAQIQSLNHKTMQDSVRTLLDILGRKDDQVIHFLLKFYSTADGENHIWRKLWDCVRKVNEEFGQAATYDWRQEVSSPTLCPANENFLFFGIGPVTKNFVGRVAQLTLLQNNFESNELTIVTGMGGIGKSELVIRFAESKKNDAHCILLYGENEDSLRNSVSELGCKVNIEIDATENNGQRQQRDIISILTDVINKCTNANTKSKVLLIIDNAEKDNTLITKLLADLSSIDAIICVIITSRNLDVLGDAGRQIDLEILNAAESAKLVMESIDGLDPEKDEEDVKDLCKTLEHFPLALQQAIGFIKRQRRCSTDGIGYKIRTFLIEYNKYESKKREILSYQLNQIEHKYKLTTFITWDMSIQKIRENKEGLGEMALTLLCMMAYFEPSGIPVDFLQEIYSKMHKSPIKSIENEIELIKKYCLVRVVNKVVSIHRLVQEVARLKMGIEGEKMFLRNIIHTVDVSCLKNHQITHIIRMWIFGMKYGSLVQEFAEFPSKLAQQMHELSLYNAMMGFTKLCYEFFLSVWGDLNIDVLKLQGLMACAMNALGKHEDAEKTYREVIKKQIEIFGENNIARLETLHLLGKVLKDRKKYHEALYLLGDLLERREKLLDKDSINDKDTISVKHAIASVLMDQRSGRELDAKVIFQEVLEWRKINLGAKDPLTLATMNNIAVCHHRMKEFEQGKIVDEDVIKLRVEVQGEEHAETLKAKSGLAWRIYKNGDIETALKMLEDVFELRKKVLTPNHPKTNETKRKIAQLKKDLEKKL